MGLLLLRSFSKVSITCYTKKILQYNSDVKRQNQKIRPPPARSFNIESLGGEYNGGY